MYNIYLELKNSKSSQYLSTISISIPPDIYFFVYPHPKIKEIIPCKLCKQYVLFCSVFGSDLPQFLVVTVRNSSCRKVMFFTPVCDSVHWGCTPPLADTPPEMATAADGMHPTGMHSCFHIPLRCALLCLIFNCLINPP